MQENYPVLRRAQCFMVTGMIRHLPPSSAYIVTGTDTDVGKTTVAAALLRASQGRYWKPVQSGLDPATGRTDTQTMRAVTGLGDAHFLPETYYLTEPLSPHRAAELDGIVIEPEKILADYQKYVVADPTPLLIETPGGLLVPLTRQLLFVDFMAQMQTVAPAPLILVARTGLGTINHTLLSIEAVRARNLPLAGIIFSGLENPDNIQTILDFSGAECLGHLAWQK